MATFDANNGWMQHDYFGTDGRWHDHDERDSVPIDEENLST